MVNMDWPGAELAVAVGTSLNLPNLPDSDPELTAAACYLYWNVRNELVRSVAAIIASFIVAKFAKPSDFLNAWVFLHWTGVPRTRV